MAFRCIQSDLKCPEESKNVGDSQEVSSALHANEGGDLGLIHAGEIRYIGFLLGCLNSQSGLLHADADADVLDRHPLGHRRLDSDCLVT